MKLGNVTIAKYMVCGQARYIRWEGDKMAGIFDSAEEAMGNEVIHGPRSGPAGMEG